MVVCLALVLLLAWLAVQAICSWVLVLSAAQVELSFMAQRVQHVQAIVQPAPAQARAPNATPVIFCLLALVQVYKLQRAQHGMRIHIVLQSFWD